MSPRRRAVVLATVLALLPAVAQACPTCGVGNGRNKIAFFVTTVFLSLLPLAMLAGIILWIVRNSRSFIASEFRESDEAVPTASSADGGSPRP